MQPWPPEAKKAQPIRAWAWVVIGFALCMSALECYLLYLSEEEARRGVAGIGWLCLIFSPAWLLSALASVLVAWRRPIGWLPLLMVLLTVLFMSL